MPAQILLERWRLFMNDFWGSEEWDGFAREIKKSFAGPNLDRVDDRHPSSNCVYDHPRAD